MGVTCEFHTKSQNFTKVSPTKTNTYIGSNPYVVVTNCL